MSAPLPPLFVLGLSGQIGDAVRAAGLPRPALALSRQPQPDIPGLRWRQGGLDDLVLPEAVDTVLSLGPLDALARAVGEGRLRAGRYVAFGSTSVHAKRDSPDPTERALADRLAEAEARLRDTATRQGATCIILRPTLVWGAGRDATVSRVVALARRWPLLPLPLDAPGLRQPVHVADLASAALRALDLDLPSGAWDVPGGEALPFGLMLRRSVAAGAPAARLLSLPWRPAVAWGRRVGTGPLARLADDLVFDPVPARDALGWAPRGFQPGLADFPEPPRGGRR